MTITLGQLAALLSSGESGSTEPITPLREAPSLPARDEPYSTEDVIQYGKACKAMWALAAWDGDGGFNGDHIAEGYYFGEQVVFAANRDSADHYDDRLRGGYPFVEWIRVD